MKPLRGKRFHLSYGFLGAFFLLWVTLQNGYTQPAAPDQKGLQIQLGEVTFRLREIESKPGSITLLELHVPVLNRSRKDVIPAHAVTVVATVKEVQTLGGKLLSRDDFGAIEGTLNAPLPPSTGRVIVLGLPLPREKAASVTLSVQINPPHGEQKEVIWQGQ